MPAGFFLVNFLLTKVKLRKCDAKIVFKYAAIYFAWNFTGYVWNGYITMYWFLDYFNEPIAVPCMILIPCICYFMFQGLASITNLLKA